jgi:hypothetical protein
MAGLAPASVCSTLRCVHVSAYTRCSCSASKTAPRWGCPCERVFHARVCARQCLHTFNLVACQRQRHDARACPCERVFHAQVCARQRLHTSVLVARQRRRHHGACPCERVFHARVCARQCLHTSVLVARQRRRHDGACPCERVFHAQVCARQCLHTFDLVACQRQRHDGRACPCERVFHAQVCARHRLHTSVLVARQRRRHDGACPRERVFHARVCARQCLHTFDLVACQRQRHDARACPCERVFHAQVCARQRLHTSVLVTHQRRRHDGACPCERVFRAQVCARQCLHTFNLVACQRHGHDGRACPRERVFHAQVCARQCLHTSVLVARPRQRHDGACPSAGHGLGSLETGVSTEPFLALDSLAPEVFGICGPPRRQPVLPAGVARQGLLPAGHGLGSLETGVSTWTWIFQRVPLSPRAHLLQGFGFRGLALPSCRTCSQLPKLPAGTGPAGSGLTRRQPKLPPALDLGPWRHESRRNPSSPWTPLLQRAKEFAALLADSPCCQQVWRVKDCCQQAMDLGPSKQESRHGPGYSSVSPSRPGLTCSRASDFGDWLFPVAVRAVSFQSCLLALDPLDLALLADSRSCRFSNS